MATTWYNKLGQKLTFKLDPTAGVQLSQYKFDIDGWNPYTDTFDANQIATEGAAGNVTQSGTGSSDSNYDLKRYATLGTGAIVGAGIAGGIAYGCNAKPGFLIMWISIGLLAGGFTTQIAVYG